MSNSDRELFPFIADVDGQICRIWTDKETMHDMAQFENDSKVFDLGENRMLRRIYERRQ